jgi:RHS repeat-associated protein
VPVGTQPANSTIHLFTGRWSKQYDTTSSLILMGARPYDPSLGRFLAVDPVDGGSLNNYDYAAQDPINKFDLEGKSQCDSHDSTYWGEQAATGQTTYGSPHCGSADACLTAAGIEAVGQAWAFVNCPAKYYCKHYSCVNGKAALTWIDRCIKAIDPVEDVKNLWKVALDLFKGGIQDRLAGKALKEAVRVGVKDYLKHIPIVLPASCAAAALQGSAPPG